MVLEETFSLSNGLAIPKLGLGTWLIDDGSAAEAVREAIAIGYRQIDTAQAYGNERGVGEGLRASGVAREDVFLTTKLVAECKSYAEAKSRIDGSLAALGVEYVDLMLIHSPQPWDQFRQGGHFFEGNLEAWRALEEAHDAGKLRAIGVSNFQQVDLENILAKAAVRPTVNQLLAHVGNTPFDLIDFGRAEGILVQAYSPVGHGAILSDPELAALAAKYGVAVAQLCIRYCIQLGMVPLPKTKTPAHMRTNAAVDFEISPADMEALKNAKPIDHYGEATHFPVFSEINRAKRRTLADS